MPCSSRFGTSASLLFRLRGALLPRNRPDAGDVATHLAHPRRVLELAGRALEAQIEPLLLQLERLVVELIDGHVPQVVRLEHGGPSYSAMRATKRVLIGSLAAASASASLASAIGTPSISNRMRPGLTPATPRPGAPRRLDLPRRDAVRLQRLEPVLAERQRGAAGRKPADAALVRLAELHLHRLQHGDTPLSPRFPRPPSCRAATDGRHP